MDDSISVSGCPLQSFRSQPHHPLAMATAYFSHVEQPQAFCLSGLVGSTETIKEESKQARPPRWSAGHVLFATQCTSSVTQMAMSLLRRVTCSLPMEAWKEGNVCPRDIKRWMSDPHLELHLDQSSLA